MHVLQLRLLMCYVATHPDKMDDEHSRQWARYADLTEADMTAITNLECIGVPVRKKGAAAAKSSRLFKRKPATKAVRKVGGTTLLDAGLAGAGGFLSCWGALSTQH